MKKTSFILFFYSINIYYYLFQVVSFRSFYRIEQLKQQQHCATTIITPTINQIYLLRMTLTSVCYHFAKVRTFDHCEKSNWSHHEQHHKKNTFRIASINLNCFNYHVISWWSISSIFFYFLFCLLCFFGAMWLPLLLWLAIRIRRIETVTKNVNVTQTHTLSIISNLLETTDSIE